MSVVDLTSSEGMSVVDLTSSEGMSVVDLTSSEVMSVVDLTSSEGMSMVDLDLSEGMSVGDLTSSEGISVVDLTSSEGMSVVDRFLVGSTHCMMGIPKTTPSPFALQSESIQTMTTMKLSDMISASINLQLTKIVRNVRIYLMIIIVSILSLASFVFLSIFYLHFSVCLLIFHPLCLSAGYLDY